MVILLKLSQSVFKCLASSGFHKASYGKLFIARKGVSSCKFDQNRHSVVGVQ
jgi:hypothetical protein